MPIPIWIPWVFVAAALLRWLIVEDKDRRPLRDPFRTALLGLTLVVAVPLSIDRFYVSQDELVDAADRAAALSEGLPDVGVDRLRALIEERLGREVTFDSATTDYDAESGERIQTYDVAVGDGDPVCVSVQTTSSSTYAGVDYGECP